MGRSLFSQNYSTEPAIRTEPEPKVDVCERYSTWNRFDPDSEDFFQNAQYEAFIDPVRAQAEANIAALRASESSSDISESSEASIGDHNASPMAVGSDDPAMLISDAMVTRDLSWGSGTTEPEWQARTNNPAINFSTSPQIPIIFTASSHSLVVDAADPPPFIPPPSFRAPSPAIEDQRNVATHSPASPTIRRTFPISPIRVSISRDEAPAYSYSRSPSPETPSPPSTPPMQPLLRRQPARNTLTPSPPPTVTPRFYSWQHHPIPAIPSSPTVIRGGSLRDSGPLTNPRARMSFARIEASPIALSTHAR